MAALLLASVALAYAVMLPVLSIDMVTFLLPWYAEIVQRGAGSISGEFSNYTPPYLYLLFLTTLLPGGLEPATSIKLLSVAFTALSAWVFAGIVRDVTGRRSLALLAGCTFPLVPTVAINAAWWGQADAVYAAFLLGCFRATLARRSALAVLLFGVALAIKLQSIFLAPYLIVLVLRGSIPLRYLPLAPAAFAALMVPAWLAGRPAADLATIYLSQGQFYQRLSMGAPNLWALVQDLPFVAYGPGVVVGLCVSVAAFLAIFYRALRGWDDTVEFKLVLASLSLLLAPYLLPKMHDRYLFLADVFTLLLVLVSGRLRWVPALVQVASLSVYLVFLVHRFGDLPRDVSVLAPFAVTAALWLVGREFWHRTARAGQPWTGWGRGDKVAFRTQQHS